MTSNNDYFSPILASEKLAKSYKNYLTSTVHFEVPEYQQQVSALLDDAGALAKGPFLEATPPYKTDKTPRELIANATLCKSIERLSAEAFPLDRVLYLHQVQAIEKANAGRNIAVVTGTGSGKTECFLIPIIDDLLREVEQAKASHEVLPKGIRALILYPMNALANDQLARLRELLRDIPEITFGRYTGETEETAAAGKAQWKREHGDIRPLPNEMLSREAIRERPPSILLTNYSMLEYLLVRPKDQSLFGGVFAQTWRHIAVDEAHIYSGVLGTEIGYLLRRLKARLGIKKGQIHCYATSATIGQGSSAAAQIARFASDLFGEDFAEDDDNHDVISSVTHDVSEYFMEPWDRMPLDAWDKIRQVLASDSRPTESLNEIFDDAGSKPLPPDANLETGLGRLLLGEANAQILLRSLANPIDLTDKSSICAIGIPGLEIQSLAAMVEVLSKAKRPDGSQLLSARYHAFFRAPEGAFINLKTKEISLNRNTVGDDATTPVYEISACRHCGQAYILGELRCDVKNCDGYSGDVLSSRFMGSGEDDSISTHYYRLQAEDTNDEEAGADEDIIGGQGDSTDARTLWLCPSCGAIASEKDDPFHLFIHDGCKRIQLVEEAASEGQAPCRRCGYSSRAAIQPLRVSPESVGSIMVYDMVRFLPAVGASSERVNDEWGLAKHCPEFPRPGSLICFSDRRQDAAYFAPALDLTYSNHTRRQILLEAIRQARHHPCSPTEIVSELKDSLLQKYRVKNDGGELIDKNDRERHAWSWVIGELTADDYRNSLEGLGLIKCTLPDIFDDTIDGKASVVLEKHGLGWMQPQDFKAIAHHCIESLRANRGLATEGIRPKDKLLPDNRPFRQISKQAEKNSRNISFIPKNKSHGLNSRLDFVNKLLARHYRERQSREAAIEILELCYAFIVDLLKALAVWLLRQRGTGSPQLVVPAFR